MMNDCLLTSRVIGEESGIVGVFEAVGVSEEPCSDVPSDKAAFNLSTSSASSLSSSSSSSSSSVELPSVTSSDPPLTDRREGYDEGEASLDKGVYSGEPDDEKAL